MEPGTAGSGGTAREQAPIFISALSDRDKPHQRTKKATLKKWLAFLTCERSGDHLLLVQCAAQEGHHQRWRGGAVELPRLRCMRMLDLPEEMTVQFVDVDTRPTGLGEIGNPFIGGAVSNAFYGLTGKWLRHLPV